jgi:hypothetical protein
VALARWEGRAAVARTGRRSGSRSVVLPVRWLPGASGYAGVYAGGASPRWVCRRGMQAAGRRFRRRAIPKACTSLAGRLRDSPSSGVPRPSHPTLVDNSVDTEPRTTYRSATLTVLGERPAATPHVEIGGRPRLLWRRATDLRGFRRVWSRPTCFRAKVIRPPGARFPPSSGDSDSGRRGLAFRSLGRSSRVTDPGAHASRRSGERASPLG